MSDEIYTLIQRHSVKVRKLGFLSSNLKASIPQLVECIRAYEDKPYLDVLDLTGSLSTDAKELEELLSTIRYLELEIPQVVGACLLLKYAQTCRDCREDSEGNLFLPEEYIISLQTWLEILNEYDQNPTVNVKNMAELITLEDEVGLITLTQAAFFLNLPRVFCSAVLHKIVGLFDVKALNWDSINPDVQSFLAGHYAIKGGHAPKDTRIGFSIAELLAYEKLPGISYDGRLPLDNLNLDSLEGFSLINGLEHLRACDLSCNQLETLTEPFLVYCEHLESLNLSDNRLRYLPDDF